jgi:hypothetical protein
MERVTVECSCYVPQPLLRRIIHLKWSLLVRQSVCFIVTLQSCEVVVVLAMWNLDRCYFHHNQHSAVTEGETFRAVSYSADNAHQLCIVTAGREARLNVIIYTNNPSVLSET